MENVSNPILDLIDEKQKNRSKIYSYGYKINMNMKKVFYGILCGLLWGGGVMLMLKKHYLRNKQSCNN